MVNDAKRFEAIENEFKSILKENSALFIGSATKLDGQIISQDEKFALDVELTENCVGNKNLIKPAHILFQYISVVSKAQLYSAEARWNIGRQCFDVLLRHLDHSSELLYNKETGTRLHENTKSSNIIEKYVYKNLAACMSMHDVLFNADDVLRTRFLQICLLYLRRSPAKIRNLVLKILSKVSKCYTMEDFDEASERLFEMKFMAYVIDMLGRALWPTSVLLYSLKTMEMITTF